MGRHLYVPVHLHLLISVHIYLCSVFVLIAFQWVDYVFAIIQLVFQPVNKRREEISIFSWRLKFAGFRHKNRCWSSFCID